MDDNGHEDSVKSRLKIEIQLKCDDECMFLAVILDNGLHWYRFRRCEK